MYDFEHRIWRYTKSVNYRRAYNAIYFDEMSDRMYIGGGNNEMIISSNRLKCDNKMEYYNFEKNKWYKLCDTQFDYSYYPQLWTHKDNGNIIYISNPYGDKEIVEWLDIREKNKEWRLQYTRDYKYNAQELKRKFNIDLNSVRLVNY